VSIAGDSSRDIDIHGHQNYDHADANCNNPHERYRVHANPMLQRWSMHSSHIEWYHRGRRAGV
jgi:hypothetical protein